MKQNKLLYGIMFILLLSFTSVFSIVQNDNGTKLYYSFDNSSLNGTNPLDLTPNNNDGVNTNVVTGVTGIIGDAFSFNGASSLVSVANSTSLNPTTGITLMGWAKPGTGSVQAPLIQKPYTSHVAPYYQYDLEARDDQVAYSLSIGGSRITNSVGGLTLDDKFHHLAVTYNGSRIIIYVDSVVKQNVSQTGTLDNYATDIYVGKFGNIATYYTGLMDELSVFDRGLTHSEIIEQYANGTPGLVQQYPYIDSSLNFTISLTDGYSSNPLTGFNAYVGSYNFSDNNTGQIITNISSINGSLFNITIEKQNYFNSTYLNYNSTINLNASIIGTNLTFRIVYNNTNITADVGNITLKDLNNSLTWITDNGYFNLTPTPQVNLFFNVSCNRSIFENRTVNFTFDARDTQEYIIYVEPTQNTFTFYDADTNLSISNATINIIYPSGDTSSKTTNSTGSIEFSWVNSSQELDLGIYNFQFDKLGYGLINFTEEINSSNVPFTQQYNISTALLNITIHDRSTGALLTENVSLELLGVFNNNTVTGNFIYKDLTLISGTYTIQATADGFGFTEQTFTFTNQEELNIDLYLLNSSSPNAGTVFVEVLDQDYKKKQGATVFLYEYDSSILDYVKVGEAISNSNGEVVFTIELEVKRYIITASITEDGTTFTDSTISSGTVYSTDNYVETLKLTAQEDSFYNTYQFLDYTITETFVNNVSDIDVYFKRTDGLTTTVCIDYYLIEGLVETRVVNDCTTSSSAFQNQQTQYTLNRSNVYEARVVEIYSGVETELKTFYYPSINSIQETLDDYNYTGLILFFATIGVIVIGIKLNKIGVACFILPIMHWSFALKLFPQKTFMSVAVLVTFICIFVFKEIRVKQEVQ